MGSPLPSFSLPSPEGSRSTSKHPGEAKEVGRGCCSDSRVAPKGEWPLSRPHPRFEDLKALFKGFHALSTEGHLRVWVDPQVSQLRPPSGSHPPVASP